MIRYLLALAAAILLSPAALHAGFAVQVSDATIAAGGEGTVDVTITNSGTGDLLLSLFSLEVQITAPSGLDGKLTFTSPLGDAQYGLSNYVFFGNNANGTSASGTLNGAQTAYLGGDGTLDGSDVTLAPSAGALLVRLKLTADAGLSAGTTFTVGVQATDNTVFYDSGFNASAYSTQSGTVTITGEGDANPVPAPQSLGLAAVGIGCLLLGNALRFRALRRAGAVAGGH